MIKEKMFLWRLKSALEILTYIVFVSDVSNLSTRICESGEFSVVDKTTLKMRLKYSSENWYIA